MNSKDFLKDIYEDFFGIEKMKQENEKLRKELNLPEDYPAIEVKNEVTSNNVTKEVSQEEKNVQMKQFFEQINKLYLTEESKATFKKMIEYLRKYQEGIEKQYIPFNLCVYSDDKETISQLLEIVNNAMMFFGYIKRGDMVEHSFYHLEKVDEIETIYETKNSIIVLKDWEGFVSQEQGFKEKFLHRFEEKLAETQNFLTILVAKNKEVVKQVFLQNEQIQNQYFEFEMVGVKPDTQDVYQEVLEKLQQSSEVSEEVSVALLDYITATYPKANMPFPEYRDKLCHTILFHKADKIAKEDIPTFEKEKTMDEIFEELNELVGLTKVKQTLQDLVSLMELRKKTKGDLTLKNTNLHMVFLGNPGTGKTTVARLIAQILYHLGYIQQNKLVEVSSKDLVAEYVGQTAPKTMAVIEKAMGGVLFIDEAYALASGSGQGNSYNEEAIATLIQAMENYRDNLVVIFAGYTKEMQAFLNSNSGIVSRIGYTMEFEDYTEQELLQIWEQMVTKAGFTITKEASEKALAMIAEYKNSKNFGNARFARNLYEKSVIKHAANTKGKKQKKILKTITAEDISVESLLK